MLSPRGRSDVFHLSWILLIPSLIASLTLTVSAQETTKIRRFGNPVSTFSKEPADTPDKLQSLFRAYRNDLDSILHQAKWDGDPKDLFDAIDQGKAQRVSVARGEVFHWMAFRKGGQPFLRENVEWAGRDAFASWRVQFESNDKIHTFIIPETCLNLALYAQEAIPAKPPSCSLVASVSSTAGAPCGMLAKVSLIGKTSGQEMEITEVRRSGNSAGSVRTTSTHQWTFEPEASGSHTFAAIATNARGETGTCTTTAAVPKPIPCVECRLDASYDESTRTFTVDGSASVGSLEVLGITQPDGSDGDLSLLTAAGSQQWTYAPGKHGRKPGDYTFKGTARQGAESDDCMTSVTLMQQIAERGAWILRVFGVNADTDESLSGTLSRPDGGNQRDNFRIESGNGFGLGLERKLTARLGLELSVIFAQLDSRFIRDIDNLWERDKEDVGFLPITLGLNVHLTPNSKADVYVGPLVGVIQADTVTYRVLGEAVSGEIEGELTFGAQIGIDVPTASKFAFTAGLRFLNASFEIDDETEISVDPLILMAGLAYRF